MTTVNKTLNALLPIILSQHSIGLSGSILLLNFWSPKNITALNGQLKRTNIVLIIQCMVPVDLVHKA